MDIGTWTFEIAQGRATATMSRGKFKHRDRVSGRRALTFASIDEGAAGAADDEGAASVTTFSLEDPVTKRTCEGRVEVLSAPDAAVTLYRVSADVEAFGTNRLWVTIPAHAHERIYGCGETFSDFNLKGHRLRIWTAEHQNTMIIGGKLIQEKIIGVNPDRHLPQERYDSYYAQPTFVSDAGYFVHVEGHVYMEMDFTKARATTILIRGNAAVWVGEGGTWEERSAALSHIVGLQPRFPEPFVHGMVVACQGSAARVDEVIATCKRVDLPLTGVWCQDWCGCRKTDFGYQVMWNWQASEEIYPDLPARIAEWRAQGVAFLGYINPFLAVEGALYEEAAAKGYCVKNPAGQDYMVTITTFPAAMVDLTNPDAWNWMKDVIKREMIGIGMAGWMADFGEYLPADAVLFSGESGMDKHNDWPVLWARLNREAITECGKEDEVFIFVRAGHTGSIKEANMVWDGDQHADWSRDQGIRSVIPATLSLSMSGVGAVHSDVGGYTSVMHMKRTPELLMRWAELSCFSPFMRGHEGNRPEANAQFDHSEEVLQHLAHMARVHEALVPYLTAELDKYYACGTPLMRPLFYHYDDAGLGDIDDEYLLGRDILVAPVLRQGAESRQVVLPEDKWVNLFTGEELAGGHHKVHAPLGTPPVFIRLDSPFAVTLLEAIGNLDAERTSHE